MRKVITHMNVESIQFGREINEGESLTIPDQAISPQELLRRYATGQPLGLKTLDPVYDDDGYIPEFYKMDKLDRLHAIQNNAEKVIEYKERYNAEKMAFEKMQKEKEAKDASAKDDKVDAPAAKKDDSERSGSESK